MRFWHNVRLQVLLALHAVLQCSKFDVWTKCRIAMSNAIAPALQSQIQFSMHVLPSLDSIFDFAESIAQMQQRFTIQALLSQFICKCFLPVLIWPKTYIFVIGESICPACHYCSRCCCSCCSCCCGWYQVVKKLLPMECKLSSVPVTRMIVWSLFSILRPRASLCHADFRKTN